MTLGRGIFGNVVSIGAQTMKENFPAIAQVDAYWEGLRNGRLMPDRSEVDPRGMKSALEYAMLLEQVVPGVARVRVSGVHLSDLFGMEIRGMPISAFFDAPSREQLTSVVRRLHNRPEVSELKLKSPAGLGRPPMTKEDAGLPTSSFLFHQLK